MAQVIISNSTVYPTANRIDIACVINRRLQFKRYLFHLSGGTMERETGFQNANAFNLISAIILAIIVKRVIICELPGICKNTRRRSRSRWSHFAHAIHPRPKRTKIARQKYRNTETPVQYRRETNGLLDRNKGWLLNIGVSPTGRGGVWCKMNVRRIICQ